MKIPEYIEGEFDILHHVPLGICAIDRDYKVVFWNKNIEEWTGIKGDNIVGEDITDHFSHLEEPKYRCRIDAIFDGGAPLVFSSQLHKNIFPSLLPNSKQMIQHVTVTATSSRNDNNFYALFTVEDVTELSQHISKLKQAEQETKATSIKLDTYANELELKNLELDQALHAAEVATQAKSQFLANMSHEIRTPMNAIMGFSDLLLDEDLTDQQRDSVNTICNSGKHLLQLINDILDFSKIEAGKLDIEMNECSLRDLLAVIESITHPLIAEKDLKFEIRQDSGLPANIHTDQARLQQCLINLVNNAIKFTEKGHVYVNVSLEDKNNQPHIRFDVEDTGIGIPQNRQHAIFESFTQADGRTSRTYGGTGLGLTITRQLAELLAGELTLTSEEAKGSVFSLIIPAGLDVTKQPLLDRYNIASDTDIAKEQMEKPEFSGHVLVAEDVETNQVLVKSLLKRMGLEVTIAADGNQALQKALAHRFDLILMDIQMPLMNGYEATRALRKEGITTPIVAVTANAMKGDDKKCTEAGCDDYLAKPIDRRELIGKIAKFLPSKTEVLSKQDGRFSQVAGR